MLLARSNHFVRPIAAVLLGVTIPALLLVASYLRSRSAAAGREVVMSTLPDVESERSLASRPGVVSVLSWNIAHGRGLASSNWKPSEEERARRLDALAAEVRRRGADVVVLNEVDFDATWSGRVDQAEYIARRAGYPYLARQTNLDFAVGGVSWQFGNAILSRIPIDEAELVELPPHADWEAAVVGHKRGLRVSLRPDLNAGRAKVDVIALHLEHRTEAARVAGAEFVAERFAAGPADDLVIVAGDLNSAPPGDGARQVTAGKNAWSILQAAFAGGQAPDLESGQAKSFPADAPRFAIDWVMSNGPVLSSSVIDSVESDHRPVFAVVSATW